MNFRLWLWPPAAIAMMSTFCVPVMPESSIMIVKVVLSKMILMKKDAMPESSILIACLAIVPSAEVVGEHNPRG